MKSQEPVWVRGDPERLSGTTSTGSRGAFRLEMRFPIMQLCGLIHILIYGDKHLFTSSEALRRD